MIYLANIIYLEKRLDDLTLGVLQMIFTMAYSYHYIIYYFTPRCVDQMRLPGLSILLTLEHGCVGGIGIGKVRRNKDSIAYMHLSSLNLFDIKASILKY